MVYIWGFPCLDYSFDVLVSWSRNLKPYNQIARPDYCYDHCYDYCYDHCYDYCYDYCCDSCLSSRYDSRYTCYGPLIIIVLYSCYYHTNCNSDYIRLDIRWHEIKVYIWGFPCLDYSFDVLFSWDRNLSVYNHSCLYQLYSGFPVLWCLCYTRSYILPLCSNPPVFWV